MTGLVDVPLELEWLATLTNPKDRRAYKRDVSEFSYFMSSTEPTQSAECRAHMSSHSARIWKLAAYERYIVTTT
jgi:hypothetical protein